MALDPKDSNAAASAKADAFARLLDGGKLRIYTGTKPAGPDTPITTQTLLAEFTLANPCAPAAVNGVLAFTAPAATTVLADGTAAWYRLLTSADAPMHDNTAGDAADNAAMTISNKNLVQNATLSISNFSYTEPKS